MRPAGLGKAARLCYGAGMETNSEIVAEIESLELKLSTLKKKTEGAPEDVSEHTVRNKTRREFLKWCKRVLPELECLKGLIRAL